MPPKHFKLLKTSGFARAGELCTPHGIIPTPIFLPVGSQANVRTLTPDEIRQDGFNMILANTYHLYLRPGIDIIGKLGGLHRFMAWDGAVLTDSGGYQVFSLAPFCKITDEGVAFRSHIDGSEHFYSPEVAMDVQRALGVDIAMPLDHVVPGDAPLDATRDAAERTLRWYARCREAASDLTTFAIVQGGSHSDLRRWHARELAALDAPGYSVGGLSVGESKETMLAMMEIANAELPLTRPRYLMGVGSPEDLVEGIARGIDMFDCVLPTRLGRNGSLFTDDGRANVRNARYREDPGPIDPGCDCPLCTRFSMAYLHHLFRNEELLGYRLASIHNIRYLIRLTERAHAAIASGRFNAFAREFLGRYRPSDAAVRAEQKGKWLAQSGYEEEQERS